MHDGAHTVAARTARGGFRLRGSMIAGPIGWEDSNDHEQSLVSEQQNDPERTGLPLRLERQCCDTDKGRPGPGWIPPRWRCRHCGVSVVTAQVPSQLKGIQNVAEQNLDKSQAFTG